MRPLSASVLAFVLALAARDAQAEIASQPAPLPPPPRRVLGPPELRYEPTEPEGGLAWPWVLGQLLPSPEVAFGRGAPSFGLRWQVTPVLWSFGAHRRVSPWRMLVVDPVARFSGSIELHASFDWFFGSVDALLARPGVRATLPLLHRGEYLALSLGTSTYQRDGQRVAYDAGLWIFSGFLGFEAMVAPADEVVRAVGTVSLRVLH